MSEWQPIETAPKDQDVLLGWWWTEYVSTPRRVWTSEVGWAFSSNKCSKKSGYSNAWMHGNATHWMPLPDAPKDELATSSPAPESTDPALVENI